MRCPTLGFSGDGAGPLGKEKGVDELVRAESPDTVDAHGTGEAVAGKLHGCGSEISCWRGLLEGVIGITLLYKCYSAERGRKTDRSQLLFIKESPL